MAMNMTYDVTVMTAAVVNNFTQPAEIPIGNDVTGGGREGCDIESSLTFQFYTWGIISNIVAVYGVIGNILSILVLRHRTMQSSTSYYLVSLAVYDTGVLIAMCLFMALPTIYLEKGFLQDYYFAYRYMQPFGYPLALLSQTGTIYTTVGFTVERYIAVCHPLKAANTCTRSRTKRVIVLIFLCSVVYNIPRFLEYETVLEWDPVLNKTVPNIRETDLGRNEAFKEIYFIYLQLIIMFLFPFLLLMVLNIQLVRAVKAAQMTRNKMSASATKDANLTIMLVAVVIVFLACQLPSIIDNILFAMFDMNTLHCSIHYIRFTTISNLMVVINSAINFVIYCLFGKRFRRVFIKQFAPCKKKRSQYKYIMYDSTINSSRRGMNGGVKVFDTDSTFL